MKIQEFYVFLAERQAVFAAYVAASHKVIFMADAPVKRDNLWKLHCFEKATITFYFSVLVIDNILHLMYTTNQ